MNNDKLSFGDKKSSTIQTSEKCEKINKNTFVKTNDGGRKKLYRLKKRTVNENSISDKRLDNGKGYNLRGSNPVATSLSISNKNTLPTKRGNKSRELKITEISSTDMSSSNSSLKSSDSASSLSSGTKSLLKSVYASLERNNIPIKRSNCPRLIKSGNNLVNKENNKSLIAGQNNNCEVCDWLSMPSTSQNSNSILEGNVENCKIGDSNSGNISRSNIDSKTGVGKDDDLEADVSIEELLLLQDLLPPLNKNLDLAKMYNVNEADNFN